jgi:hypothetical protein
LIRNPLLLMFLVILAGEEPLSELPSQRAELYRRYVEELIDSWEAQRHPQAGTQGKPYFTLGPLKEGSARQAAQEGFYYLGWSLHLAYYGGKEEQPHRENLLTTLTHYYEQDAKWGLPSGDWRVLAEAVLDFWQEAGVLEVWRIEGEAYFTFRHMSFQEYAVANILARRWEERKPALTWDRTLRPILHHYVWREPILLLAGRLQKHPLSELVRRLLQGPSPFERYLHRDRCFAYRGCVFGDPPGERRY